MRAQGVEGPNRILGGDGRAVVEARALAQLERHPHPIGGDLHGLGDVAVRRVRLVGVGAQQGVPEHGYARCRRAAHDERVEAVEAADGCQCHVPALGRVRVRVGEVREVRRQGGRAVDGYGVAAGRCLGERRAGQQQGEQEQGGSHGRASLGGPALVAPPGERSSGSGEGGASREKGLWPRRNKF